MPDASSPAPLRQGIIAVEELIMRAKWPFRVKLVLGCAAIVLLLAPFFVVWHCDRALKRDYAERFDRAMTRLAKATTDHDRFYPLTEAASMGFLLGKTNEAGKYAQQVLAMAPRLQESWNYGNAIHDGNLVLGRIAVMQGRIEDAKRFLIEAGKTPGSPQLDSFGPDPGLAKDLLERGERETVLEYFQLCSRFWKDEQLEQWSRAVKAGKTPDL
jgi:hypothetical protein